MSKLAKLANVDRGRLAALEAGEGVSDRTIGKVGAVLDQLESQLAVGPADSPTCDGSVEFIIEHASGVRATIKGSIRHLDELQSAAAQMARDMGASRK